jgi:lambda family phage portal protein
MAILDLFRSKRSAPSKPRARSTFMRGELSPFFMSWRPALREWSQDVAAAYTAAAGRAVDAIQNSGWISGGIDQAVAGTVGTGLRLNAKPDYEALGWTVDQAQEWSRKVEWRWDAYCSRPDDCDVEGKSTIGKLTAQALRTYFAYGEITAALPYVQRIGNQHGTKVQLLLPSRLSQRSEVPRLVQGVRRDETGYPLSYIIQRPFGAFEVFDAFEREIPARDPWGRAQFIHVFDGFPGQVRGIAPITPVLKIIRQYDQFADATLTQALIQAIFAASIKSTLPTEQTLSAFQDLAEQQVTSDYVSPLAAMLEAKAGWYEGTNIDLGSHGKIAHLSPGDELTFHSQMTPNETYDPFTRSLLREISRCMGITFEQFSGDYTGATYSSVRMGTAEMHLITTYRRVNVASPFVQAIYEAWLEEEIEAGLIDFPDGVDGFIANRGAGSGAHWRGPAKPVADDLKQAKALQILKQMGVVTEAWIGDEMGWDWEENCDQLAREKAYREKLGIDEQPPAQMQSGQNGQNGQGDGNGDSDGTSRDLADEYEDTE